MEISQSALLTISYFMKRIHDCRHAVKHINKEQRPNHNPAKYLRWNVLRKAKRSILDVWQTSEHASEEVSGYNILANQLKLEKAFESQANFNPYQGSFYPSTQWRSISSYSVRMRGNTDQKNSELRALFTQR